MVGLMSCILFSLTSKSKCWISLEECLLFPKSDVIHTHNRFILHVLFLQYAVHKVPIFMYYSVSSNAAITNLPISSISPKSFNALNGRVIPTNSNIGSSLPSTRTIKFPLVGLSLLICTIVSAYP
jgi:hypothetical protein